MATITSGRDGVRDPFEVVLGGRDGQRALCRDLEALADRLGVTVDAALAKKCLAYLDAEFTVHQRDEEAVFQLLRKSRSGCDLEELIDLAVVEHVRHREYAFEIADWLLAAIDGRAKFNPDALGYLLRCMFESLRQHLAWEEVTLFGTARQFRALWSYRDLAGALATNRRAHPGRLRLVTPSSDL